MKRLIDVLIPSDSVQIRLKRRGKVEAGIYKDEKREVRSPSLQDRGSDDQRSDSNTQ